MLISKNLILIAAQDAFHQDAPIAETNCACPGPGDGLDIAERPPLIGEASLYQYPVLHMDRVEDFYLAFNPFSQIGVTVFNQPLLDLLNIFRQSPKWLEYSKAPGKPKLA
jgi:hypothetical protein